MGGSAMSSREMRSYYEDRSYIKSATNASQVFKSNCMIDEFNPAKMKLPREACDSALSPHSRGIVFAEDVTGSMDSFLLSLMQNEFPRLITQTYQSVSYNPHIMFMGVGDVEAGDQAPLQVTQFETDVRMLEQLEKIFIEKRGGWNSYESYALPWYFCGKHVEMDCWNKRREKGFLFTFGDEEPTPRLNAHELRTVFGNNYEPEQQIFTGLDCLEMASEKFYCYHVILHGSAYQCLNVDKWKFLMGSNRVCDLSDHECLPELVITIFRIHEGLSKTQAINRIQSAHAQRVVREALEYHEEMTDDGANADESIEANIDIF